MDGELPLDGNAGEGADAAAGGDGGLRPPGDADGPGAHRRPRRLPAQCPISKYLIASRPTLRVAM